MTISRLAEGGGPKTKVAVVGATGYSGLEIIRLLFNHTRAVLSAAYSTSSAGEVLGLAMPSLRNIEFAKLEEFSGERAAEEADFFFLAGGHGRAMEVAPELLERGKKCVDVGGDFRLKIAAEYPNWYGFEHLVPRLLAEAVYGLSEWRRAAIREARLVANPGCYATGALLAVCPFLTQGVIAKEGMVINGVSGISGAGRSKLELAYHFPEASENLRPYRVTGHQHVAEMEQEMSAVAGEEVKVTFVPQVAPLTRGLLTTACAPLTEEMGDEDAFEMLYKQYQGATFVRVLPPPLLPETGNVKGSNFCDVAARVDQRTGRLLMMSAIDNLGKGAAGQAVQNMNLMCGFDEAEGLWTPPVYP